MDPVTISVALGAANTAFKAIKAGFSVGRDLEGMSKDVGRWMSAVSDIDNAEKMAKNPPLFGKLFKAGSVEEAALQAYSAKKKLEEQRQELKTFLNLTFGPTAYADLLQMEGEIRKQRQQTIYKQQKMRQQIAEIIAWVFLVAVGGGFIALLATVWVKKASADGYTYKSKQLTRQQKLNNGSILPPLLTTCRLKKQKVYKDKIACIYEGANKRFELDFADIRVGCPKQFRCEYRKLNDKEPSIDQVMDSLRSIAK